MQKLTIDELEKLKPLDVLNHPGTKERFVNLFKQIHKTDDTKEAEKVFAESKKAFGEIIQSSPKLSNATGLSIYGCMLDLAITPLPLTTLSQPLIYILPQSVKKGNTWYTIAKLSITAYGEVALRIKYNQIKYVDNPVVVFEGDEYTNIIKDTGIELFYKPAKPPKSKKAIGGFVKITRIDGSIDYFFATEKDIEIWRIASASKQEHRPNPNYSNFGESEPGKLDGYINPSFLKTKILKHAFKNYPKIPIGKFSSVNEEEVQPIDYGLDESIDNHTASMQVVDEAPQQPPSDVFGGAPMEQPQGIQVEDDDDIF